MELTPASSKKNIKQTVIAVSVILAVLIVVGAISLSKKDAASDTNSQQGTSAASGSSDNSAKTTAASYKDGSYSSSGEYLSPGGTEKINVSITVKDNAVTETSVDQQADTPDSARYQADFKQNFTQYVIGKKLNDIKLSHVSGSSLTSAGFNKALEQIKQQAKQS